MSKKAEKRERRERRREFFVFALSSVAVPVACALIYAWAAVTPPRE